MNKLTLIAGAVVLVGLGLIGDSKELGAGGLVLMWIGLACR